MSDLDFTWSDLRLLLVASRVQSLTALAEELAIDPTTASRRMRNLEDSVGVALFWRSRGALGLSEQAHRLLGHAQKMEQAEQAFRISAQKLREAPQGIVRVSAPPTIARLILSPAIAGLHRQAPGISLEIDVEPTNARLEARETDIAVRLGAPRNVADTVLIRKLGTMEYAVFGQDGSVESSDWIAYSKRFSHVPEAAWIEDALDGAEPVMRCNDPMLMAAAIRAGVGRSVLPVVLGTAIEGLRQLGDPILTREVWLLRNRDSRGTSVVSKVHDWLGGLF